MKSVEFPFHGVKICLHQSVPLNKIMIFPVKISKNLKCGCLSIEVLQLSLLLPALYGDADTVDV